MIGSVDSANKLARPVVITRPLAQAQAFAARVAALGRDAVILPLLEIAPAPDAEALQRMLRTLDRYALVVFVSPNAIDAVGSHLQHWPPDVVIGVVGEGSRLALQRHGIGSGKVAVVGPGPADQMDSEALFKALDIERLRGKRALIVRAQSGRNFLADLLQAEQVEVDFVTAYQRLMPSLDSAMAAQLHRLTACESEWVITSSEALRHLQLLATQALSAPAVVKLQRQKIVVSHARIAETARSLGFSNVTATGSGDERLIAALQFRP